MSYLVYINNLLIETTDSKEIVYNKQCNDISELADRQANFTYTFKAPLTANNKRALGFVGMVGNTSNIPYQKNKVDVIDSDTGLHLIRNGWAVVKQTSKDYEINTYDGSIDLFKAIENKNFGDDVDLSEINHEKNLTTVIDSFTNEDYRYIINDYGGKTHLPSDKINIDYLIPSVRVKYLWDKIFSTFGFNYIGNVFDTFDFDQLWLTYPKGINAETTVLSAEFKDWNNSSQIYDDITIIEGTNYLNKKYIVSQTGSYKIDLDALGIVFYLSLVTVSIPATFVLKINGAIVASTQNTLSTTQMLIDGDIVEFEISLSNYGGVPPFNYAILKKEFIVNKFNSIVSFSDELKQLSITDFFKEILNRFSLTIFIDVDGNYVFKTFDERLQSDIVDWSNKFSKRVNESYTPKTYGQVNNFLQNYNDKEGKYNNGSFSISNQNLAESKDLIKSKIYSAEKDLSTFMINILDSEIIYPTLLYSKEVTENSGIQEVKYKELSGRFYFLRNEIINKEASLKSEVLGLHEDVTFLPIARFITTAFKDFVPKYYSNIDLLLNEFLMHKIEMNVNTIDFVNLNLDSIYYFEQEQNYYFLNKMQWQKGKLTSADFYRIRYSEQVPVVDELTITVVNTSTNNYAITVTNDYLYTESTVFIDVYINYVSDIYTTILGSYSSLISFSSTSTVEAVRLRSILDGSVISNTFVL